MTDNPDCIIICLRIKRTQKESGMQVILPEFLTLKQ